MTSLSEYQDTVDALTAETPASQERAIEICASLVALEHRIRGVAWSGTVRLTVQVILEQIQSRVDALCSEYDLASTSPAWTLEDVIRGGPGERNKWPGYSR